MCILISYDLDIDRADSGEYDDLWIVDNVLVIVWWNQFWDLVQQR